MKRKLLFFLSLIGLSISGYSQSDFRDGYIVLHSNDTVQGLVDYRLGVKGNKTCVFRKSKETSTINYLPAELTGYGFDGDAYYLTKEIKNDKQNVSLVFLEVLVQGYVSLYNFEGRYFIEKADTIFHELTNESIEIDYYDQRVLIKSNSHIATMNILLSDCEVLIPNIQRTKLDERPLTKIVLEYNSCKGEPSNTYKSDKPWLKSTFGATIGVNLSILTVDQNEVFGNYLTGSFKNSISPIFGVSYSLFSPRVNERFSLGFDFLYLETSYTSSTIFETPFKMENNFDVIDLTHLKIPISVNYTFPIKMFTPFVSMGVSNTFHLSKSSEWIQRVEENGTMKEEAGEALVITDFEFGAWGGVGVYKSVGPKLNASVEFRYEITGGISAINTQVRSSVSNFQLVFGVRTKQLYR